MSLPNPPEADVDYFLFDKLTEFNPVTFPSDKPVPSAEESGVNPKVKKEKKSQSIESNSGIPRGVREHGKGAFQKENVHKDTENAITKNRELVR